MEGMTTPALRFTKDQLIEALEARRPWAERTDQERLAAHQKAERQYLTDFRAACRDASKWTYEQAKANYFEVRKRGRFDYGSKPSCPESRVAQIDRWLNIIRASRQSKFIIGERGGYAKVFHLLTHDDALQAEMC